MYTSIQIPNFSVLFDRAPVSVARLAGGGEYTEIGGNVWFYQTPLGTLVVADIKGLPKARGRCGGRVFGFHIHEGGSCSGNSDVLFADVGAHYNPYECPHPYHAGDMPPLFGADGFAFSAFLTDRFSAEEVIGKTVIIHDSPDDFTTQPSGNSGVKIACGVIRRK